MKAALVCIIILTSSLGAMAQSDSLPYQVFPPAPSHYSAGTVISRMLDGVGFRYYWATEGLRPVDLAFRPNAQARTSQETLEHIYGLSTMIISAIAGDQGQMPQPKTYEELRKATLDIIKKASTIVATYSESDLEKITIDFGDQKLPFWNMINGPISDCLWHIGQVVSFRRSSGNPFNGKVELFLGKLLD